jgi:hypothetical protein
VIDSLDAAGAARARADLVALLADAVDSGASLGFLPPLDAAEAGDAGIRSSPRSTTARACS